MATKAEREVLLKEKLIYMKQYEEKLYEQGFMFVAGVDEVGRGPLAGPVVAACVVLPQDFSVLGVDDSKKLSEKKREELFEVIKEKALAYGIGLVDNCRIDKINILEATKEAMVQAVQAADMMLKGKDRVFVSDGNEQRTICGIDHLLIDALTVKDLDIPQKGIVKGDANSISIAAASILAKVTRDRMMLDFGEKYPAYSFEKNKGYGTKAHYEGIEKAGICPIHRRSFLKKYSVNS